MKIRSLKTYDALWEHDSQLIKEFPLMAGVDEVGRGPLVGNVVAACVVLKLNSSIPGVRDSKKIPESTREVLFSKIRGASLYYGIGEATPAEIDSINILQATFLAMKRAIKKVEKKLKTPLDLILVDGNRQIPGVFIPQKCLVKGDNKSASIAAASILAKVTRDRQLDKLHLEYPNYNFKKNKGYGTKEHIEAILNFGFTPHHRKSFKPKALSQLDMFAEG